MINVNLLFSEFSCGIISLRKTFPSVNTHFRFQRHVQLNTTLHQRKIKTIADPGGAQATAPGNKEAFLDLMRFLNIGKIQGWRPPTGNPGSASLKVHSSADLFPSSETLKHAIDESKGGARDKAPFLVQFPSFSYPVFNKNLSK